MERRYKALVVAGSRGGFAVVREATLKTMDFLTYIVPLIFTVPLAQSLKLDFRISYRKTTRRTILLCPQ